MIMAGACGSGFPLAAVVELADTRDLKSLGSDTVPVRSRSAAPKIPFSIQEWDFSFSAVPFSRFFE